MPQENEKCCSYSRTGAVELSFLLSRTKAVCVAGCRISRSIFPSVLGLPRKAPNRSRPSPVASAPAGLVEPCGSIDVACRVVASAG